MISVQKTNSCLLENNAKVLGNDEVDINNQMSQNIKMRTLQSVSWSLAEFRHNKIVQSPHENYFNVCQQHKEK